MRDILWLDMFFAATFMEVALTVCLIIQAACIGVLWTKTSILAESLDELKR